jgi:hypothetical protein
VRIRPLILNDDNRIGIDGIDAVLRDQFLADLRLERCKLEVSGLIVFDHEIDRGVTKITNAVE